MSRTHFLPGCPAAIALALVTAMPTMASAQTHDNAPVGLSSSRRMTQDSRGGESWTYAQPSAEFLKYRTVIVDPTTVYDGPDAQFNGIDPADRARFAAILTNDLRSEIGKSFAAPATVLDPGAAG